MRSGRAALAALLLIGTGRLHAQAASEPQLVFSVYAGLSEGADLWKIPAQPLLAPLGAQDTVAVARVLRPGLVAGLVTTYYPSAHLGLTGDIAFFGVGSAQRCDSTAAWKPDSRNQNRQVCTSANGVHVGTNVVGLLVGLTYRPAGPSDAVQPFLRVSGGPGLLGTASFIETTGGYTDTGSCQAGCEEPIITNQVKPDVTWVVNLSAGISIGLAPGYRVRMEARDVVTALSIATGPRDPTNAAAEPPRSTAVRHLPTLLFGLDIVLERRHSRRY